MSADDWVKAATADDSLVAELLASLHHSRRQPPPLKWTVRQPRSRSLAPKSGVPRGSPTNPLSWTGASTSQSGGAGFHIAVDGSEESSRAAPRSKVTATIEANPSKRSRKKKTMTELKDEELSMQKEKRELKRVLASVLATLEKRQCINVGLKRIKVSMAEGRGTSEAAPSTAPPIKREEKAIVLPDLNIAFVEFKEEARMVESNQWPSPS